MSNKGVLLVTLAIVRCFLMLMISMFMALGAKLYYNEYYPAN